MLCGHETDDIPIHMEDLTPIQQKTSSTHSIKTDRLSPPSESKPIYGNHEESVDSLGVVMTNGIKGLSISGPNRPSPLATGMEEVLSHSVSGLSPGDKEDRQSILEKKYKVEKVKPTPAITHSQPSNHFVPMFSESRYQYQDNKRVPFPRTCGATFCSNDFLVVFNVPSSVKPLYEGKDVEKKSLSDLISLLPKSSTPQWMRPPHPSQSMFSSLFGSPTPPSPTEGVSISDFFTEKHTKPRKHTHHKPSTSHGRSRDGLDSKKDKNKEMTDRTKKVARIQIYNMAAINPVNLYLAKHYKLDLTDKRGCCEHNAKVASKVGRKDLVQLWTMISHMSHEDVQCAGDINNGQPWAMHPFGRALIEKYLSYYEKLRDVQTMAMIVCMFWDGETRQRDTLTQPMSRPDSRLSFEAQIVEGLASSSDSGWEMLLNKGKRSRSLSETYDDFSVMDEVIHRNNSKMLNPELKGHYEQIKRFYADILYKWGLLNQRTQILKHTVSVQTDKRIEFSFPCSHCYDNVQSVWCIKCRYPSLNCAICHIGVRGPANVCLACGHGGHSSHMMKWFHTYSQCPTGCGCNCLEEATL